MTSRKKPSHKAVEVKTVNGGSGTYIWMRTPKGQYHAFREITAFEAAKDCDVREETANGKPRTVPAMCKEVWDRI
jgi:hypothetical protein